MQWPLCRLWYVQISLWWYLFWHGYLSLDNADSRSWEQLCKIFFETHIFLTRQYKMSKLRWERRKQKIFPNCLGFWISYLSFSCKVDKDFVTNTSGNFGKSLEIGSKKGLTTLRPGNRVRWGFRDWKCQLFTMPTNYSSSGRSYYRTVKVEDDELG